MCYSVMTMLVGFNSTRRHQNDKFDHQHQGADGFDLVNDPWDFFDSNKNRPPRSLTYQVEKILSSRDSDDRKIRRVIPI